MNDEKDKAGSGPASKFDREKLTVGRTKDGRIERRMQPGVNTGCMVLEYNGTAITQAHHVIPKSLADDPIWKLAGMTVNDRKNFYALPTKDGAEILTALGYKMGQRSTHWGYGLHGVLAEEMERKFEVLVAEGKEFERQQQETRKKKEEVEKFPYKERLLKIIAEEKDKLKTGERKLLSVKSEVGKAVCAALIGFLGVIAAPKNVDALVLPVVQCNVVNKYVVSAPKDSAFLAGQKNSSYAARSACQVSSHHSSASANIKTCSQGVSAFTRNAAAAVITASSSQPYTAGVYAQSHFGFFQKTIHTATAKSSSTTGNTPASNAFQVSNYSHVAPCVVQNAQRLAVQQQSQQYTPQVPQQQAQQKAQQPQQVQQRAQQQQPQQVQQRAQQQQSQQVQQRAQQQQQQQQQVQQRAQQQQQVQQRAQQQQQVQQRAQQQQQVQQKAQQQQAQQRAQQQVQQRAQQQQQVQQKAQQQQAQQRAQQQVQQRAQQQQQVQQKAQQQQAQQRAQQQVQQRAQQQQQVQQKAQQQQAQQRAQQQQAQQRAQQQQQAQQKAQQQQAQQRAQQQQAQQRAQQQQQAQQKAQQQQAQQKAQQQQAQQRAQQQQAQQRAQQQQAQQRAQQEQQQRIQQQQQRAAAAQAQRAAAAAQAQRAAAAAQAQRAAAAQAQRAAAAAQAQRAAYRQPPAYVYRQPVVYRAPPYMFRGGRR